MAVSCLRRWIYYIIISYSKVWWRSTQNLWLTPKFAKKQKRKFCNPARKLKLQKEMDSGCHNPSQRGNGKFALSHRKFPLVAMHLLLSWVDWVKLGEINYFFLEKINCFETGNYFLWKLFIKLNLCCDKKMSLYFLGG